MAGLVCREFDEFADELRGVDGRYLLTARATHAWKLQVAELGDTSVMWGQDGAANLFHASCLPGVHSLFVPLLPGHGVLVNGLQVDDGCAAWLAPGAEFHMRGRSAQQWLAVMIRTENARTLALLGEALPKRTCIARPSAMAIARLVSVAFRVLRLGNGAQGSAGASRAELRDQLLCASLGVMRSVTDSLDEARGRPMLPRATIIGRALDLIDARLDQAILLSDLCEAAGVSGRTLNAVFRDQLEMSPHQYIMVRRLHGVHAAIRSATPEDTVSEICGRFGIWDFGRFARAYRSRFGMAPSRMLARSVPVAAVSAACVDA